MVIVRCRLDLSVLGDGIELQLMRIEGIEVYDQGIEESEAFVHSCGNSRCDDAL